MENLAGRLSEYDLLFTQLMAGRPVIIYVRPHDNPGGEKGHFVVISGWDYNAAENLLKFRILDPRNWIDYGNGEHNPKAKVRYATYEQLTDNTQVTADITTDDLVYHANHPIGSNPGNVWVATMTVD